MTNFFDYSVLQAWGLIPGLSSPKTDINVENGNGNYNNEFLCWSIVSTIQMVAFQSNLIVTTPGAKSLNYTSACSSLNHTSCLFVLLIHWYAATVFNVRKSLPQDQSKIPQYQWSTCREDESFSFCQCHCWRLKRLNTRRKDKSVQHIWDPSLPRET